ncbi:MAG: hypothetical protein EON90_13840 [Brevundimonas sp.]|nr:MAG: hypothetical protein EON90_13840 [Brevundimonas sp.]
MPQDKRIIIAVGAGLAVLAAVVLALLLGGGNGGAKTTPPAGGSGLTVDLADAPNLDPARELDCYVNGQSVGKATLSDCARRNGVATGALDVGVDQSGAAVAFRPPPGPPALEQPLTMEDDPLPDDAGPEYAETPARPVQAGATCMRHTGSEWRTLSSNMSLNACVQALYAGVCVSPGDAQYGRWGDTTLRLVPRRVEQSNDDTRFRTLIEQDRSCQFPDAR